MDAQPAVGDTSMLKTLESPQPEEVTAARLNTYLASREDYIPQSQESL